MVLFELKDQLWDNSEQRNNLGTTLQSLEQFYWLMLICELGKPNYVMQENMEWQLKTHRKDQKKGDRSLPALQSKIESMTFSWNEYKLLYRADIWFLILPICNCLSVLWFCFVDCPGVQFWCKNTLQK